MTDGGFLVIRAREFARRTSTQTRIFFASAHEFSRRFFCHHHFICRSTHEVKIMNSVFVGARSKREHESKIHLSSSSNRSKIFATSWLTSRATSRAREEECRVNGRSASATMPAPSSIAECVDSTRRSIARQRRLQYPLSPLRSASLLDAALSRRAKSGGLRNRSYRSVHTVA